MKRRACFVQLDMQLTVLMHTPKGHTPQNKIKQMTGHGFSTPALLQQNSPGGF